MSSMLAQLRSESTKGSSSSKRNSRSKNALFMTQDGAAGEAGMSLVEGEFDEEDEDSDSDVSLSDFKQPRAAAKTRTKTPPVAAARATAAHNSAKQKLRGQFSDSFQDEVEPSVSKVPSGDLDAMLGKELSQDVDVSIASEEVKSVQQALSVMAIDSTQASFITLNTHEGKDEVNLQSSKVAFALDS